MFSDHTFLSDHHLVYEEMLWKKKKKYITSNGANRLNAHTHAHFRILWSLQKTMVACCISRIMTRRNKWVSCYFYGFMICMPALIAGVCVPGHLLLVINYSPKDTFLLWHHSDFPLKYINMLGPMECTGLEELKVVTIEKQT